MRLKSWNPWHGCHKISQGCKNCYVYSKDFQFGKDSSLVTKTKDFDLPLKKVCNQKTNYRDYKLVSDAPVYTCLTSDFFVQEADEWREQAWQMIKQRQDLFFLIITKRIDRFFVSLPSDWNDGYDNVSVSCTVENQSRADYLLPIYLNLPIKYKSISCSPILEYIDFCEYLKKSEDVGRVGKIDLVVVGGESGEKARVCDYDWVLQIRNQCIQNRVDFCFHQTGARLKLQSKTYEIPRKFQHLQAKKADINILSKFHSWLLFG